MQTSARPFYRGASARIVGDSLGRLGISVESECAHTEGPDAFQAE